MPIDAKTAAGIARLGKVLPDQARVLELMMLAGNGLAAPLAQARMNQARREAVRAKLKFGAQSPELARKEREHQAAEQLSASIDAEIARLSLDPPIPVEGEVAVYGYVRDHGKPVPGLSVALVAAQEGAVIAAHGGPKVEVRTAADGSFTVSGAGPGPFGLLVRRGNTVASMDEDPWYTPAPRAYYRLIDLAGARGGEKPDHAVPPKLLQPPEEGEAPGRSPFVGLTLHQALDRLDEERRPLSRILLNPSRADHGHVVGATMDSRNGAVSLEIAVGEGNAERLDVLAVLVARGPEAERIGIGSIEQARERLKAAQLDSLGDVAALLAMSDDTIARKIKVSRGAQAKVLRQLLGGALARLEER